MLIADQVSFQYPQDSTGLSPISLQVSKGNLYLSTGISGSGKSTFARCLSGLIPHLYRGSMTGDVLVDDQDTQGAQLYRLTEKVGLVFQNPAQQMLAPTVEDEIIFGLENLGLSIGEIQSRLEESLDLFKLHRFRSRSPQQLSSGEQQKVALAAVTARRPPYLILDEPLSMLDTSASLDLVQYLEKIAADGQAVVVFEHRDEWFRGISGVDRIHLPYQACELPGRIPPCPLQEKAPFILEVEGLNIHRGSREIFNGFGFSACSGEMVAIVGKNGVGKTTLLRALAGLQSYQGSISIHSNREQGQPDLGLVFENPDLQLFNATVKDEITYRMPDFDERYYQWLITSLGLARYEKASPLLLSEGEKKRLALATVMMRKPSHGILLDEPSLGQDHDHKKLLADILHTYVALGKLVIITTHDLWLTHQADRMILLNEEGIVADGKPAEIFHRRELWKKAGLVFPSWAQSVPREGWRP